MNFNQLFKNSIPKGEPRQKWRTVKLTPIIMILLLMQVSTSILAQQLTLRENKTSLKNVFKKIRKQTGFIVVCQSEQLNRAKPVTVKFYNLSLEDGLKQILDGQDLDFSIENKSIIIKAKEPALLLKPKKIIITQHIINGKVVNDKGQSLIGATVKIKGANTATITNEQGLFTIFVSENEAVLTVSYVSFTTKEIPVTPISDNLVIVLQNNTSKLDEVQVIAYGTTTQRKSTGDISTITAEDIAKQPVSDIFQALQGRVPGLEITPTSGFFSGTYNVKIRGNNVIPLGGIGAVSDPLYILDGIPITIGSGNPNNNGVNQNGFSGPAQGQNPLLFINPSDIESISVLKDADATAIYGARGANGVILITTKKAKPGKTSVDVSIFTGYSQQATTLKLMNSAQYLAMRREALKNDGLTPDDGNAYDLLIWDATRNNNWQKQLLRTAKTTDGQLSFSGGDEKNSFRLNGGYHKETPPFPGDFSERRVSSLLTIDHTEFDKKLKITLTLNFANTNSDLPQSDPTGEIFEAPDAPDIYTSSGQLNFAGWRPGSFPMAFAALQQPYKANTNNLVSSLNINYTFFNGLSLNASGGYNLTNQKQQLFMPGSSQDPESFVVRSAQFGENNVKTWVFEPTLIWSLPFKNSKLETLIGTTYQESTIDGNNIIETGFVNDSQLEDRSAASNFFAQSNYTQTKIQSFFGRVNYNLSGRYIININVRRDGSSRFGPGNQFGTFGSVGAAWLFSEETFVKNLLPFISFGKLSGSYGTTGGDQIDDYAYLSTYKPGYYTYQGKPILTLNNAFNPNYNWTVNKKIDLSLNIGFLSDRILLSTSYYQNRSGNQLVNYPLPSLTGFSSVITNFPALVQNKGYELQVTTKNVQNEKFIWNTSANISFNRNKLLAFPSLDSSPYAGYLTIGQPLARAPLFHYLGMDTQTGHYFFEDKNHDGNYDYVTDQDFYSTDPSFTGGIENNIQYRNLSLSFFFNFVKKKGFENAYNYIPGAIEENQLLLVQNRWQKSGDVAQFTGYTTGVNRNDINLFQQSDALWVDASYIRLQDVSIAYRIPASVWGKSHMPNTSISLQGQNLLTFTNYKGLDPSNPGFNVGLPTRRFLVLKIQLTY